MARVFISYRRGDSAGHTGRLVDSLENRFGSDSFFRDVEDLEPGVDFHAALDRALSECAAMLVMIGRGWISAEGPEGRRLDQEGDFVRTEVAAALAREEVRVIPVLVGGATMPEAGELPDVLQSLARRNAIEITDTRWDYDTGRLGDTLAKHQGLTESGAAPTPAPAPGPAAPAAEQKGGLLGKIGIGVGGAIAALVAGFFYLSADMEETPGPVEELGGDSEIGYPAEGVSAGAAATDSAVLDGDAYRGASLANAAGLTWTGEDSHVPLDWDAASTYCDAVTADGLAWRLPTLAELDAISGPGDQAAGGTGSVRLPVDLTTGLIWSSDLDPDGDPVAFDFDELMEVVISPVEEANVHAVCVAD